MPRLGIEVTNTHAAAQRHGASELVTVVDLRVDTLSFPMGSAIEQHVRWRAGDAVEGHVLRSTIVRMPNLTRPSDDVWQVAVESLTCPASSPLCQAR